ncbi:MAG: polynucleotide adenylyltransferase PcnB, partial [Pseudomonas sp.]
MLKKLFQSFRPPVRGPHHKRTTPEVINSGQHSLQRGQFSRHAVSIV